MKKFKNDIPPTRLKEIFVNEQVGNDVFKLDNYTCRHCGDKASKLMTYQIKEKIEPSTDIRHQLVSVCIHCQPELERMKKDNIEPFFFIKRK